MTSAGRKPPAVSPARRTVVWVGYDKWRGEHLAGTNEALQLVPATMDGREAYAVVAGLIEHVTWDSSKPAGYRLSIR